MKALLIALVFTVPFPTRAGEPAAARLDPQAILQEARSDAQAGNYELALLKHLWFHENALKYQPALTGVRLSFAISYWRNLAEAYPPALVMLKLTRDAATKRVAQGGGDAFASFMEMNSINEVLSDEERTTTMFLELDRSSPDAARKVFNVAEPALLKAKKYDVCGKYLDPERDFSRLTRMYELNMSFAARQPDGAQKDGIRGYAENSFTDKSATLVALLVINDRKPEAEKIAAEVKQESKNAERDAVIDAALDGKLPKSQ